MKREQNGRYTFDGKLDRICVCGHSLSHHGAGHPDCLFYSLSSEEKEGQPGHDKPDCSCQRFRQSRKNTLKTN